MPKAKDKFLGLVFVGMFLLGFILVAWASGSYDRIATEQAYISDDNARFLSNYTSGTDTITSTGEYWVKTAVVIGEDITPIYQGNNTWAMASDGLETSVYQASAIMWTVEVPNMDKFIMKTMNISFYLSNEIDDIRFFAEGISANGTILGTNAVFLGSKTPTGAGWLNFTHEIPLYNALAAFDMASQTDTVGYFIHFTLKDTDEDGMVPWTYQAAMEIYGEPQAAYTVQDWLTAVLFAAGGMGWVTALFMTDSIDLEAVKKAVAAPAKAARRRGGGR